MSVTDPIELARWHDKVIVVQGRETFYDKSRRLITFDDEDEAKAWTYASFGVIPQWREGEE